MTALTSTNIQTEASDAVYFFVCEQLLHFSFLWTKGSDDQPPPSLKIQLDFLINPTNTACFILSQKIPFDPRGNEVICYTPAADRIPVCFYAFWLAEHHSAAGLIRQNNAEILALTICWTIFSLCQPAHSDDRWDIISKCFHSLHANSVLWSYLIWCFFLFSLLLKWQYTLGTLFTSDLLYLCIVLHTPTHFLSQLFVF